MRRYALVAVSIALALGVVFAGSPLASARASEPKILEFDTLVGLPAAFTLAQNPIRGINGGGLPWAIGAAHGELKANGELEIEVQGLVLAAGLNTGRNPVANFRAIVSCLRSDGSVENIMTGLFPATTGLAAEGGGNAHIEAALAVPQPCIAPIVFVTSPSGAWFASTGG